MDKNLFQVESRLFPKRKPCIIMPRLEITKEEAFPPGFDLEQHHKKIEEKACTSLKTCIATCSLVLGFQLLHLISINAYYSPVTYQILLPIALLCLGIGFSIVKPHMERLSTKQLGISLILVFTIFGILTGTQF